MTIYTVKKKTPYDGSRSIAFFSSREKAMCYIMGMINGHYPRGREICGNREWEYDKSKLFNMRNWNKYEYVLGCGDGLVYIEAITVM